MLLYLLFAVCCLFYLLAVVRMWPGNRFLAVAMLVFLPAGLYALVRCWNAGQDTIRAPLLVAFWALGLCLALLSYHAAEGPSLDAESHAGFGVDVDDSTISEVDEQSRAQVEPTAAPAYRLGSIPIAPAHATIEVPEHFRFLDAQTLSAIGADAAEGSEPNKVGWLVHEGVNLAAADAWHIRIDWIGDGYVADDEFAVQGSASMLAQAQRASEGNAASQAAGRRVSRIVDYAEVPTLDAASNTVTWVEEVAYTNPARHVLDCHALKLGRYGAFVFTIDAIATSRQELCLLSVRLAARRTGFDSGHAYADHSRMFDHKSGFDLVSLVTGAFALPN